MSKEKYTKELLSDAVSKSTCMADVFRVFGVKQSGGLHYHLLLKAKKWGIDLSHFKGKSTPRKTTTIQQFNLEDVCTKNSNYSRGCLKRRLLQTGILKNECSICHQQNTWNDKTLVMVLDHINGVRDDNRLENLRLLCPNCNSQQKTFCGRNTIIETKKCKHCQTPIRYDTKSGYCGTCLFQLKLSDIEISPESRCVCGNYKSANSKTCRKCTDVSRRKNKIL